MCLEDPPDILKLFDCRLVVSDLLSSLSVDLLFLQAHSLMGERRPVSVDLIPLIDLLDQKIDTLRIDWELTSDVLPLLFGESIVNRSQKSRDILFPVQNVSWIAEPT